MKLFLFLLVYLLSCSSDSNSNPPKQESVTLVSTLSTGFSASGGLLVGPDSTIYIADFGTGVQNGTKLLKFSVDGVLIGEHAAGLLGATGGAFNQNGELFWSSYSAGIVHKIDVNGVVTNFASVAGPVAIEAKDNLLYVASCDANMVVTVDENGVVSTFATDSRFNCVNGMAFDDNSQLFVCNFEDGKIFKITANGQVSLHATIPVQSSVNMVYHDDNLYVTARNAHSIYKVSTLNNSVTRFAGTGSRGANDGNANTAQFSFPNGIAVSLDGSKLFVNDVDPNSGTNSNGVNFNPNSLRQIELSSN